MSLHKKYGIPEATVKQMVCDGVISCSVSRHYEIYDRFRQLKEQFPSRTKLDIIIQVAEEMNTSEATVDKVVYSLHKKS
jgi:predicted transcriptional regulator